MRISQRGIEAIENEIETLEHILLPITKKKLVTINADTHNYEYEDTQAQLGFYERRYDHLKKSLETAEIIG